MRRKEQQKGTLMDWPDNLPLPNPLHHPGGGAEDVEEVRLKKRS